MHAILCLKRRGYDFRPAQGEYSHGVELIMGTRTTFESREVKLSHPMDADMLFMYTPGQITALKLLPLVKIMASPANVANACYFYNRLEKGGIRFVSHYFEPEPEITSDFPEALIALKLIDNDFGTKK